MPQGSRDRESVGTPAETVEASLCLPSERSLESNEFMQHIKTESVDNGITLRPLGANDAAALMTFYHGLSPATIRTFRPLRARTTLPICAEVIAANLAVPRRRFDLAAWHRELIVGWAFLDKLDSERPHLGLGIADAYQRQGLGSALFDELLAWTAEQAISEIELMVVNDNVPAIHLYTSRGFTVYAEEYDEIDELTYLYMNMCLNGGVALQIREWSPTHPQWSALQTASDELHQTNWVMARYDWHQSSHTLVATKGGTVVGFLRLVTQPIGADDELPPTELAGIPLLEAKVLAFGVMESYRRQGIGRALQAAALRLAKNLGCYQLRSYSSGDKVANHQLKLTMGFALHRTVRGEDRLGAYFVMPLQTEGIRGEQ
ncbi:MAG: GNAT family N-acetyltransferase [Caldilineaceae bacterium]